VPLPPSNKPMRAKLRNQRDLRDAMHFSRLNVRQLAELCGVDHRGNARHRSTISHLHAGVRDTCDVFLARRIEEALRMHPGSLFMPVGCSSHVAPTTPRKQVAA
jgi:hypothetical protein